MSYFLEMQTKHAEMQKTSLASAIYKILLDNNEVAKPKTSNPEELFTEFSNIYNNSNLLQKKYPSIPTVIDVAYSYVSYFGYDSSAEIATSSIAPATVLKNFPQYIKLFEHFEMDQSTIKNIAKNTKSSEVFNFITDNIKDFRKAFDILQIPDLFACESLTNFKAKILDTTPNTNQEKSVEIMLDKLSIALPTSLAMQTNSYNVLRSKS